VTLVVAAEELALLASITDEEEHMVAPRPNIDGGFSGRAAGSSRSPSIPVRGDRRRASFLGSMTRFARMRTAVFQATRLPFGPGSTGAAVPAAAPASDVEGCWSPALLRACAEGPFSLRRGLDSELALVQVEHHPFVIDC